MYFKLFHFLNEIISLSIGIEPTTYRLTADRSAPELRKHVCINSNYKLYIEIASSGV